MKVWELSTLEIGYSPYHLPEEDKVESFIQLMDKINDEAKRVDEEWEPLILLKSEQCIDPDFFDLLDTGALIVSKQGCVLFQMFFNESEVELLPFLNDENEFFLIHLIKSVDCLDKENSIFEALDNGIISDYDSLAFDYDKIKKEPVFRIPELPYTIFVTSDFKYHYDELGLKGIDFDDENLVFID